MNGNVATCDDLLEALNQESVLHPCATSNVPVSDANDLDFLADRRFFAEAQATLLKLGFKACVPRRGPAIPGVVDYCGLDNASGRLVRLHLRMPVANGEEIFNTDSFPGKQRNSIALESGGAVVTFVGPEASGKSTFISECQRWLGESLPVFALHLGKPSTLLTIPANLLMAVGRKLFPNFRRPRYPSRGAPGSSSAQRKRAENLSLPKAIRAVWIARDRLALATKARRMAQRGTIVLCDRYPSASRVIDGPRLTNAIAGRGPSLWLYQWLARIEQRLYQQIPPPDVVVQLQVSLETAIKRNRARLKLGKETDGYIEFRYRQYQGWLSPRARSVHVIDGEQPLPDVLRQVKHAIWESI